MKKILSIDGGGIRGIIPVYILREVEKKTGKNISDLFDLVVGTSIGGIIALVLSVPDENGRPKYSATNLIEFFEKYGHSIFRRSFWKRLSSLSGLVDEEYSHLDLENILNSYLGEADLDSALSYTLISSYDIENCSPFFFKSWKEKYKDIKMKDVARATSAAPTFFEPVIVDVQGEKRALIDGGIFANHPGIAAFTEANRIFPDSESFIMLSLGTGNCTEPIKYEQAKHWGKIEWALPVLDFVFDGVNDAVDYHLKHMIGSNFIRIQADLNHNNKLKTLAPQCAEHIEILKKESEILVKEKKDVIDSLCELLIT